MTTPLLTDIHCHILPGVDDGPAGIEQSLALARALVADGVGQVFATPHYITRTAWALPADQVRQKVDELQAVLQEHGIPLTLHPGMEIALHQHLIKELKQNKLQPLGDSNYYLLEFPFQPFRDDLLDTLLSFQNYGKIVIVAHPERVPVFQRTTESLFRLIEQGVLTQVNIGSLLGLFGKKAQTTALQLLECDAIHFVASDAHGPEARRPPTGKEWLQLEKILGPVRTRALCIDNPARILSECN
jgi:protein-tyrosine phosphatase